MEQKLETKPVATHHGQTKPIWRIAQGIALALLGLLLLTPGTNGGLMFIGLIIGVAGLTLLVLGIVKQVNRD